MAQARFAKIRALEERLNTMKQAEKVSSKQARARATEQALLLSS